MTDWITSYVGTEYAQLVSYALYALSALLALLIVIWLFRKLSHGTFISGGRSAQPRLAVQDAAPIDSHRRLVLVRRDDVEHLLLIGGNTDIVVEQNIRPHGSPRAEPLARDRQPEPQAYAQRPMPAPTPPQRQTQMAAPPRPAPVQPPAVRQEPRVVQDAPPAPAVRSEMDEPVPQVPEPAQEPRVPTQPPAEQRYAPPPQPAAAKGSELSIDDELEKMLGDFGGYTPQKT